MTRKRARHLLMELARRMHLQEHGTLREIAVSLGADKKKLYGTSRTALVVIIDNLKKGADK